jgi:hypothetical protein
VEVVKGYVEFYDSVDKDSLGSLKTSLEHDPWKLFPFSTRHGETFLLVSKRQSGGGTRKM